MGYKTNYLTQVTFQVNFKDIEALENGLQTNVQDLIEKYSEVSVIAQKNVNINVHPDSKVTQNVLTTWACLGSNIQIRISRGLLQIINLNYSDHTHFHGIINDAVKVFSGAYKPFYTTVSFRYINIIRDEKGSAFDFENYIEKELLQPSVKFKDNGLTRSVGNMVIRNEEHDIVSKFTYGYFNSEFPNKIVKKEFVLDYTSSIDINTETDTVNKEILLLRGMINNLFEQSVTSALKTKMNE